MLVATTGKKRPVEHDRGNHTRAALGGAEQKDITIILMNRIENESGQGNDKNIPKADDDSRCRGELSELQPWKKALQKRACNGHKAAGEDTVKDKGDVEVQGSSRTESSPKGGEGIESESKNSQP